MRCGQMHTVLPRIKTEKKGKIDFHIWIIWTDLVKLLIFYGKRNDKHNHIYLSHFDRSTGAPRLPPAPSDFKGKIIKKKD